MSRFFQKIRGSICASLLALTLGMGTIYAANAAGPANLSADSVEYNTETGIVTATGNVLMTRGDMRASGATGTYNLKTKESELKGRVVLVRGNMRMICERVVTDAEGHSFATGDVQGEMPGKSFASSQVNYYPEDKNRVLMPHGGVITNEEGRFVAEKIEGWLDESHYIATGNAHLLSEQRNIEAGGDRVEYEAKEAGRVIITGNAWAFQDNNTLRGNRLTLYLAPDGKARAIPN